jgi:intracellular sulfur oxidation DsrE/DsrF family protein
MSDPGAIQRAKLFANVDELLAWKQQFLFKQTLELNRIANHKEQTDKIQTIVLLHVQTIEVLVERIEHIEKKLETLTNIITKL